VNDLRIRDTDKRVLLNQREDILLLLPHDVEENERMIRDARGGRNEGRRMKRETERERKVEKKRSYV
jgi:hypothetical protein